MRKNGVGTLKEGERMQKTLDDSSLTVGSRVLVLVAQETTGRRYLLLSILGTKGQEKSGPSWPEQQGTTWLAAKPHLQRVSSSSSFHCRNRRVCCHDCCRPTTAPLGNNCPALRAPSTPGNSKPLCTPHWCTLLENDNNPCISNTIFHCYWLAGIASSLWTGLQKSPDSSRHPCWAIFLVDVTSVSDCYRDCDRLPCRLQISRAQEESSW